MKRGIIFLIFLLFNTKVFGLTNNQFEEMMEYSWQDTHSINIPIFVKNGIKINFKKDNYWKNIDGEKDRRGRFLQNRQSLEVFLFLNGKKEYLFKQNEFLPYGQKVVALTCKESKNKILLFIMTEYGTYNNIHSWFIQYRPYAYEITNSQSVKRNKKIENQYFSAGNFPITTDLTPTDISPKDKKVYPYYNREKILERLYEKNVCIRPLISLKTLERTLKAKKNLKTYNKVFFEKLLPEQPIEKTNLTTYNNIAYYLQKAGSNKEAVYLLEKILKKYPNRTVAYYNLGDAYWALGDKKKARKAYTTYTEQMCDAGKQKRIPKVVIDRITIKGNPCQ